MPAHCHDDRPPLFARTDQGGPQRLPEPSPPPWQGCDAPPDEFYRPIFNSRAARRSGLVPPIAPREARESYDR
jgi:hypothetical protein